MGPSSSAHAAAPFAIRDNTPDALQAVADLAHSVTGMPMVGLCTEWDGAGWSRVTVSGDRDGAARIAALPGLAAAGEPGGEGNVPGAPGTLAALALDPADPDRGVLFAAAEDHRPCDRDRLAAVRDMARAVAHTLEARELQVAAMAQAPVGITLADARRPDTPLIGVNDTFVRMTGYSRAELIGRNCRVLQGDDRDQPALAVLRDALATGSPCEVVLRNYRRDGTLFWNELRLAPVRDSGGHVTHFIGLQNDITERKRLEERVADDTRQFREVVGRSPTGMLVVDAGGGILYANGAAEQLLGRSGEELVDSDFGLPATAAEGVELEILRPGREPGVAELSAARISWNGRDAWLLMLHDITARRDAERRVEQLAYQDGLTGVANRVRLRDRLETAINAARRHSDQCIGVVLLGIDRFKEINESLGHSAGDELLVAIANRLDAVVRDHDLVARLGGDEFAVLFEGLPRPRAAVAVAQKLIDALDAPFTVGERELRITAGIGISLYPNDATDPSTLLKHADTALSACKGAGGAGFRLFDEELGERAAQRLDIDQRLRRAVDADEFEAYYQAQVALQSGGRSLVGFEALARWNHPERGVVLPGEFIDALEDMNLIGSLGDRMLAQAIARLAEWGDALGSDVAIAVNASAHQLRREHGFVERVLELLQEHSVPPERLMIELTESAVASQVGESLETLRRLDRAGVRVALDDFGTGYSALSYLRILPVSLVKIDRSFVTDLPDDRSSAALVRAIVEMAHGVDREVLAEGVETEAQEAFLREVGCDYAQGFRYARAETAARVQTRWLEERSP